MTIPQTRPLARLAANEPRTMDVSFVYGNIIKQPDAQAVVNSANANLRFGSGVAGAIHGAAGQRLEDFCEPLAPLALGEVLITPGFDLPNPLERLNAEIKRRTNVVGIFPNDGSIVRLVGAMMLEQNDEWSLNRRYMQLEGLQTLCDTPPTRLSAVAR